MATAMLPQAARAEIKSVMLEGGPIASHHFQSGENNFRQRHFLGIAKFETADHGSWALYFLNPNSVRDTSVGAGWVTPSYDIPLGSMKLELSLALGLVTGYDYPLVPLIAGEARLVMFEGDSWDAGLSVAADPYYTEDDRSGDKELGIVATTPFLSVRYHFH
jgi:hypothetical protein